MTPRPHPVSTITDEQLLAEFRRRFPGVDQAPYPKPIFNFLNEYRTAITFEAVIWRRAGETVEVLLRDRTASEDYPLACHVNGGYMLRGEQASEVLTRVVGKEVGPQVAIKTSELAGVLFDRYEQRGPQVHIIYILTIQGEPTAERLHWEPTDQLATVPNLLDYHRQLIQDIALPVITGARAPALWQELIQIAT